MQVFLVEPKVNRRTSQVNEIAPQVFSTNSQVNHAEPQVSKGTHASSTLAQPQNHKGLPRTSKEGDDPLKRVTTTILFCTLGA